METRVLKSPVRINPIPCKVCGVLFSGTVYTRLNCDLHYRQLTPELKLEVSEKIRQQKLGKKRKPFSKEWKDKLAANFSRANKGVPKSEAHKVKIRENRAKQVFSPEVKALQIAALVKSNKERSGKNSHFWKGGITPLNVKIRGCTNYCNWRSEVLNRDKRICQDCGISGVRVFADHIKGFSQILTDCKVTTFEDALACSELWDIKNGRTLCFPCHRKTGNFGVRLCS